MSLKKFIILKTTIESYPIIKYFSLITIDLIQYIIQYYESFPSIKTIEIYNLIQSTLEELDKTKFFNKFGNYCCNKDEIEILFNRFKSFSFRQNFKINQKLMENIDNCYKKYGNDKFAKNINNELTFIFYLINKIEEDTIISKETLIIYLQKLFDFLDEILLFNLEEFIINYYLENFNLVIEKTINQNEISKLLIKIFTNISNEKNLINSINQNDIISIKERLIIKVLRAKSKIKNFKKDDIITLKTNFFQINDNNIELKEKGILKIGRESINDLELYSQTKKISSNQCIIIKNSNGFHLFCNPYTFNTYFSIHSDPFSLEKYTILQFNSYEIFYVLEIDEKSLILTGFYNCEDSQYYNQNIIIEKNHFIIGKDIKFKHSSISNNHCEIFNINGKWFIKGFDLNDDNFINYPSFIYAFKHNEKNKKWSQPTILKEKLVFNIENYSFIVLE